MALGGYLQPQYKLTPSRVQVIQGNLHEYPYDRDINMGTQCLLHSWALMGRLGRSGPWRTGSPWACQPSISSLHRLPALAKPFCSRLHPSPMWSYRLPKVEAKSLVFTRMLCHMALAMCLRLGRSRRLQLDSLSDGRFRQGWSKALASYLQQ